MTVTEKILIKLRSLPQSAESEILGYLEFLAFRESHGADSADESILSVTAAMRGMEQDDEEYTMADIRESV